jgi:hypothetical protein
MTEFALFPGEGHQSVNLIAFGHALRALYSPPSVALPRAALRQLVGAWKSDSGDVVSIRYARDRLLLYWGADSLSVFSELGAESDTSFFTTRTTLQNNTQRILLAFTHDSSTSAAPTILRLTRPRDQRSTTTTIYRRIREPGSR